MSALEMKTQVIVPTKQAVFSGAMSLASLFLFYTYPHIPSGPHTHRVAQAIFKYLTLLLSLSEDVPRASVFSFEKNLTPCFVIFPFNYYL